MEFNIQPWEIDLLTYREIEKYISTARDIAQARAQQQQQANRR